MRRHCSIFGQGYLSRPLWDYDCNCDCKCLHPGPSLKLRRAAVAITALLVLADSHFQWQLQGSRDPTSGLEVVTGSYAPSPYAAVGLIARIFYWYAFGMVTLSLALTIASTVSKKWYIHRHLAVSMSSPAVHVSVRKWGPEGGGIFSSHGCRCLLVA